MPSTPVIISLSLSKKWGLDSNKGMPKILVNFNLVKNFTILKRFRFKSLTVMTRRDVIDSISVTRCHIVLGTETPVVSMAGLSLKRGWGQEKSIAHDPVHCNGLIVDNAQSSTIFRIKEVQNSRIIDKGMKHNSIASIQFVTRLFPDGQFWFIVP